MFVGSVAEFLSCADRFHAKKAAIVNATAVSDCVPLNAYFFPSSELAFIFVLLLFDSKLYQIALKGNNATKCMGCATRLIPYHIKRVSIVLLWAVGTPHRKRRAAAHWKQTGPTMLFASIDFVNRA